MSAYYNEIDRYCAQWLRNLIAAGHIAPGDVDERSIEDVRPSDLAGYTQCHFFAGIGVWSYALRLAGWPDDRPVWTGSCPCQSFSAAGKGAGFDDQRHLWPAWFHLIRECCPPVVFGEQVAAAIRHGWLDLVHADLEGQGYACGHAVFGAHSVGAPHIRQRMFFVADDSGDGRRQRGAFAGRRDPRIDADAWPGPLHDGASLDLCHADNARLEGRQLSAERAGERAAGAAGLAGGGLVYAQGVGGHGPLLSGEWETISGPLDASRIGGFWSDADWIACRDGKTRPVEPGTFPLAHGAAARVGRLRAYGNAIVAPCAEAFIRAYLTEEIELREAA
jgi:DNA (cytosine-5)-methyltransferase 1